MKDHVAHMRLALVDAPRCRAKSKRSGERCQGFAVKGCSVCRMHGARANPRRGSENGRYKSGRYTQEAVADRKIIAELLREARAGMAMVCEGL